MNSHSPYPQYYLYKRIVQAKLFIDSHYEESINLDNISDEAYFSKFHFIRLFKKTYGKTPHQYLTQVRIDHAKLLLQQPTPISHVCSAVGFDSVTSFTGLFKKYTGQSPSEFQQRQLQRQTDISCVPLKFVPNCFVHPEGDSNK